MAMRIARATESTTRAVADEGAIRVNMDASMPEMAASGKRLFTE